MAGLIKFAVFFLPSWPGLSRPSTTFLNFRKKGVDARHEAGHDEDGDKQ
jgi:hypothetical protein